MSRKGLNIYKRKDGRWEARYIKSRNALGKPKYGYLYASSYREVRCDLQHTLQLQGKPSGSEETAFVYEEMKGRPVMVDDIKPSTDGNGMTLAVDPKKLMGIGSTGGKKPTSHIPAASRAAGAALEGVAGMYAGSSYPLEPNQPVILGRDPAYAKIVFSQGAQKISRRHCEVMFNSQVQKYRVTDFSSNGTYVNGSRLPANSPVLLARGTELP